ncbi:hypothetical protein Q5P01_008076 [Channa striata]|uniref:CHHC U11-48K-type domain-containing protein n=1 Tax=Channa striata TaxID=64152 RepID=A0AA88SVE8_CHASR|nr:hypothetical protein Q5P01_008076 [Channa striata]
MVNCGQLPPWSSTPKTVTLNGHIYFVRDDSAEVDVYNPQTNVWDKTSPMSQIHIGGSVAALDGKLYVSGGFGYTTKLSDVVEAYDPITRTCVRFRLLHVQSSLKMAAIRFGTTSGPSRIATAGRAQLHEDNAEKSNCDPDKLVQCPFDKNHQIRSSRFPYHLLKCKKNHPKLARELKTCPFNARHLVHKHELAHHTETCEDRISIGSEEGETTNENRKWQVPVTSWVNPNTTEDWDNEVDDDAPPFVWGVNTVLNQRLDMRPTSNLRPTFRAPSTLPWSGFKP